MPGRADGWVRLACQGAVVRRAFLFAFVVGPLLIAINHADAIASGDIDGRRALKMGLTMLVPYVVSSVSSVLALRRVAPPAP